MRQTSGIGSSFTFPCPNQLRQTYDRSTLTSCPGDIHPYAALCSAAREAIVVNEGTDERFNMSIRIQAYKIGIIFLP
jgi:hypothetical protein